MITSALNAVCWSFSLIAWCAQVTVAPESSRIRVLRNGMPQVGTGSMPSGGQEVAMVIGGLSAPQKNAQKKAKKKNTSEVMNSAMPEAQALRRPRRCGRRRPTP